MEMTSRHLTSQCALSYGEPTVLRSLTIPMPYAYRFFPNLCRYNVCTLTYHFKSVDSIALNLLIGLVFQIEQSKSNLYISDSILM